MAAELRPHRGLNSAAMIDRRHLGLGHKIMVNRKLTMIKNSLAAWFLSHTQGDRMKSGGEWGRDTAILALYFRAFGAGCRS